MSTDRPVPPLLKQLIDDATLPPGNAPIQDALAGHARHRGCWYADLIGPLLVPASALGQLPGGQPPGGDLPGQRPLRLAVVGDTGLAGVAAAFEAARASDRWVQFEVAVAKRGEDPQPGLRALLAEVGVGPDLAVYAELPLTWGLLDALDTLAAERAAGARVAPKFRTGGLAAELFPTPVELAAVVCACRDRGLPFKLTAGLHHGLRFTDPETGLTHHGFLNVLAACLAAAGAEVPEVAELLATLDPLPVVEAVRARLAQPRPLWASFGCCDLDGPLADLANMGLIDWGRA